MKLKNILASLAILGGLSASAFAADTTVTLSGVHVCCGSCVRGVDAAIKPVTGVTAKSDQAASTVVLTAPDHDAAQKAVNALVLAGYYGKSSDPTIKVDDTTGATDAKVKSLDVSGVHLCCAKCVTAVKGVLGKVDGAQANTVAPNAKTFNVSGDFSGKSIFDGLHAAGLTGKVAEAK